MKNLNLFGLVMVLFLSSCIGDDIIFDEVEPTIRILNPVSSIEVGTNHQFEVVYLNNIGQEETVTGITWASSNTDAITIDQTGLASAVQNGLSTITAEFVVDNQTITANNEVSASGETVVVSSDRSGKIVTTSSYVLEGDFTLKTNGEAIDLDIADNFRTTSALPGLYLFLSNNPNSISGALEIGEVTQFSGAQSFTIRDVGLNDFNFLVYFCKPFNVKVGEGEIQ